MAGKKSKSSGAISNGGRQKAHERQEAKRQAEFKLRRENGTNYVYRPIEFKPGTAEYEHEKLIRQEKVINSRRNRLAFMKSMMAKLDNQLAKQKEAMKEKKEKYVKRDRDLEN